MPRAFLITHRRYNGPEEFAETLQDYSPERGVRLAEYGGGQPTSDGVSDCGSETSSECPEELYNLTKLAEVSLAAAAGTLIHPDNLLRQRSLSPTRPNDRYRLGPAASSKHQYHQQPQHQQHHQHHHRHHHQHPHQYHNHEEIRLEHHAYHRNGFQRQVHQHGHHTSCQQQQQQQQRDEQEYETLRKPPTIEDVTLRERSRLFFERIEREREILEGVPRDSEKKLPSSEKEIKRGCPPAAAPSEKASAVLPGAAQPTSGRITAAVQAESSKACGEDNEEHECPDCGKKYSTSSNLARHRQTHRSLGDKKARRCPHCDKVYVSMPAYSMHVRTHNQGCKCHYCGKCFSRPWLLQGHIRTHTGEKPFKCTICNKAFADKSNLRAHIQTHSNTKPHVCTRCGKAFALKSYLYKHEESSCMRAHQRTSTEKREASSERSLAFASSSASPASTAATSSTTTTTMTPATITQNSTSMNTRLGSAARAQVDSEMNQRERSGPSVIVPRQGLSDPFVDLRRTAETSGKTLRPSAFSAIIKHTKLSQHQYQQPRQLEEEEEKVDGQEREPTLPKRRCREPNTRDSTCLNKMAEISRTKEASKMTSKESPESTKSKSKIEASDSDEQSEYLSRMVIRTSVISPNPEHLGRLSSLVGKNSTTFDLIEPSRTSRISLNFAIG